MSACLSICLTARLPVSDPLPFDFVLDKCLGISLFPRLRFYGRWRNLKFTIIITMRQLFSRLTSFIHWLNIIQKNIVDRHIGIDFGGGREAARAVYPQ